MDHSVKSPSPSGSVSHLKSIGNIFSDEGETNEQLLKSAYACAVHVTNNYLGQPTTPFTATVSHIQHYMKFLFDEISTEERENIETTSQYAQCGQQCEIRVKVKIKDADIHVSPRYSEKEFPYVFCRLWINEENVINTKTCARSEALQLDDCTFTVENYEEDILNIEFWISSTSSIEVEEDTEKTKASWSGWKNLKIFSPFVDETTSLIGGVSQVIKNLPCAATDLNLTLDSTTTRHRDFTSVATVSAVLFTKKNYFHDYHLYMHMIILRHCYEKQLSTLQYTCLWKTWMEMLPSPAVTLLHQHALQNSLSMTEQTLCSWIVSSSLKMNNEKRISYVLLRHLLEDLIEYCAEDPLNDALLEAYHKSYSNFLLFACKQLVTLHYNFDLDADEKVDELFEFLQCIMLGKMEEDMMDYDLLKTILQDECYNYYVGVIENYKEDLKDENSVAVIADCIKAIIKTYLLNHIYLDDIFARAWKLNYSELTLKYLNSNIEKIIQPCVLQLVKRVECITYSTKKNTEPLLLKMLQIYHSLRNFVEYLESILPENISATMMDYPAWFGERMILQWFLLSTTQSAPFIQRAVECDLMDTVEEFLKHGTSAIDVVNIIDEMVVIIWLKMQWEDQFYTHTALLEAINASAISYAKAISDRIQTANFFCLDSEFSVTTKLCVAMSNVYALYEHLHVIEEKISEVICAAEKHFSIAFVDHENLVQHALLLAVSSVFIIVLRKIKCQLQTLSSGLDNLHKRSVSSKPMSAFCSYIEECLQILYSHLKPCPFNIMLRALWIIILDVLLAKAKGTRQFFKWKSRVAAVMISPAMDILQKIFYCKGLGLTHYEMENEKYLELKEICEFK